MAVRRLGSALRKWRPSRRATSIGGVLVTLALLVACSDSDSNGAAASSTSASTTAGTTDLSSVVTSTPVGPDPSDSSGTTAPAPSSTTTGFRTSDTVRHPAGIEFALPEGWEESPSVIATQFATDAVCAVSVIVDRAPPDPDGDGSVLQSAVQVCARPVDDRSLDAFMESVYGTGIPEFVRTEVGGMDAYRRDDGVQSLIFLQTSTHRVQIATSAVADPDLETERLAQIQQVIESITLN